MKGIADYAVGYDIGSDAERSMVDKLLKGFRFRAQTSVFECLLNRRGEENLIAALKSPEMDILS